VPDDPADGGGRGWSLLFYTALGLGFLCKGPIGVLVAAVTLVPYLLCARRLGTGLRRLADGWGLLVFAVLALSWPVPVLLGDPNALKLWMLEMGQKTGAAGIAHRPRVPLAVEWPEMTAPWLVLATGGVLLPFARAIGAEWRPRVWFPWWWAVGNLAMFCGWSVAKANYFLPCLPAAAILAGLEWVRLSRAARGSGFMGTVARRVLQGHWVLLFVAAVVTPVVVRQQAPAWLPWVAVAALALAAAAVLSAVAWHRGADAGALAPLAAGLAVAVLVLFGSLAPRENGRHSHRELAATLDRLLPPDVRTVMFYHELDEGLWFYLKGRTLEPVPGSQPEYNDAFRLAEDIKTGKVEWDNARRAAQHVQRLVDWLRQPEHPSRYVLVRRSTYDQSADTLGRYAEPLHREPDLDRHEVVLLRVKDPAASPARVAGAPATDTRRR
jgi:4-amino-4-deoxy-L-arabinose transferase-like glycosyltransferase